MKLKKLLSAFVAGAMVLGTVSIPAFAAVEEPVADEALETAGDIELFSTVTIDQDDETTVAKIGENSYTTLANALDAATGGDVIEITADEVTMPDNTVISKAITIKGSGKDKTTLKVNNKTKIMSENVLFIDLKIDGSGVRSTDTYNTVIYIGADNVSFKNVNFYEGPDDTYGANVQVGVNGHSLEFTGCDFSGAFRGVHFADAVCDTVFDNCVFKPGAYPFNVNAGTPQSGPYGTILVKNSTLMGWTSWGGVVEQVTFDNCVFKPGNYNYVRAYNNATFKNCSFTNTTIDSGNSNNFKWIIDNCEKDGELLRRSEQFFSGDNWKYQEVEFIFPSDATVIDTAKTTGGEITLDSLNAHENVDVNEDATYKVVVSTAPADDAEKANEAIKANDDDNTSKAIFDISVMKTDSNGTTKDVSSTIIQQQVTITLGETPKADTVKVYHVNGNDVENISNLTVNGKAISFTAPSFSTYAVTYDIDTTVPVAITDNVNVLFSRVSENSNQFYITLKSDEAGKKINRFMSTDLAFINNCATVDYDITPATNVNVTLQKETGNSREYHFEMDGRNASSATGEGITIGTITFEGYGTLDFSVDTAFDAGHLINIVNTSELNDNIVANYTEGSTLLVNNGVSGNIASDESGTIEGIELKVPTKDLTVNIAYNNAINNNAAAYQAMTVTISGGDLTTPLTYALGNNAGNVTFNNDTYTLTVADTLTKNTSYTVTVEGLGYRTARYTVNMATDKTLNFWNNVMDHEKNIETGVGTPSKTNFLAGDIVKDNQINIYDLSAVVSYFGTSNNVNAESAYARYDLNRDGVIDSKDVAYVLVSWNN